MPLRRTGFTLIELLVVVSLMGIILALSAPKIRQATARSDLRSARSEVATSIARARAIAIQKGRPVRFQIASNVASTVIDPGASAVAVGATTDLKAKFGYDVNGGSSTTSIVFDSRGFANTSGGMIQFVLGSGSTPLDVVCVTGMGTLMKQGCTL